MDSRNSLKTDGRSLPAEVQEYLRKAAVNAVINKGMSPEIVTEVLDLSPSCIYKWLRCWREKGVEGLARREPPGSVPMITAEMDAWLYETVATSTPQAHGYDTSLWTRDILAALLQERFGVSVCGRTVSGHLRRMGLSWQKPLYKASEQAVQEVEELLAELFPRSRRLAQKRGADIAFEDESGVSLQTHTGRTWGVIGQRPVVRQTGARGQMNVLAAVEPTGRLYHEVTTERIDSGRYIEFLQGLLEGRDRMLIVLADRAAFHRSAKVRAFVRANRDRLRVFFLPRYSPEHNPAEHAWEEIKDKQVGRQPLKNMADLKRRVQAALKSLQGRIQRVISFFHLPETRYAAVV